MWIHGWITVWVSQGTSYSKTYVELTRCQTPFSVIFVGYHTEVLQQPMLCCSVLSRLVPSNTLRPQGRLPGSSVHGGSLGKNIGMGCYFLLQSNNINQCKAKEKKIIVCSLYTWEGSSNICGNVHIWPNTEWHTPSFSLRLAKMCWVSILKWHFVRWLMYRII